MWAIARAALLTVCVSLYAGAQSRSLALYAGPSKGLSPAAIHFAEHELQRLLTPARIELLWKDLDTRKPAEQFDQVVVMSFDGACSEPMSPRPVETPPDETVSLGDTSISEGRILPFIRVNCRYLAQMLAAVLRSTDPKERDAILGRALGRIVAHEIYHIVGETTEHQTRGVAKASFSVRDLTAGEFDFDHSILAQTRPGSPFLASPDSVEFLER